MLGLVKMNKNQMSFFFSFSVFFFWFFFVCLFVILGVLMRISKSRTPQVIDYQLDVCMTLQVIDYLLE